MIEKPPVWDVDISPLFAMPYWIDEGEREDVGYFWTRCMAAYLIDFTDYDSVTTWAVTIYNHLASRNMPLTRDQRQMWPDEALVTLRAWINAGCPRDATSTLDPAERIPPPVQPDPGLRVRKDITALSEAELTAFRAALDDIMHVGSSSPSSPWQQWAYLHTNWCLHYQEAFGFWHRAFLMYLEDRIGMAIPYWDWMAWDAADPTSPRAGLPQAFLDETYVHPDGSTRPNPLRFAAAKDGRSKKCDVAPDRCTGDECRYVQRLEVFSDPADPDRARYFEMPRIFQEQVADALLFDSFSTPQGAWGATGVPWANIPVFTPPQPDDLYPFRQINFDGLYEQPHDNYHGWIGYDMADNAYTAFDPIFISYHANIDRMLEIWIRAHPGAQYTTQTPLQPFVGPLATAVDEASPERWRYTTLGQMAQDCRRLGYDYGPVTVPSYRATRQGAAQDKPQAAGLSTAPAVAGGPWIAFSGVRCTHDSYTIDVFLEKPDADAGDIGPACPNYVGRFSRIGMGIVDDKGRCIRHGVTRLMTARRAVAALGLSGPEAPEVTAVVTRLSDGHRLGDDEAAALPGFVPRFHWGAPPADTAADPPATPCCGG